MALVIDNWFEFELNGVKYKGKAVGGEPPMRESGQALRAQNAQLVQGESSAVFNIRPDVLVFNWTDWSGGEGQVMFDPENPGRYYEGLGVDPWSTPGQVRVGPAPVLSVDNGGTNPLTYTTNDGYLVVHDETLKLVADGNIYSWSTASNKWGTGTAITGLTGYVRDVCADGRNMYILDENSIIRYTSAGVFSDWVTGLTVNDWAILELGDYVYTVAVEQSATGTIIKEYLKSNPATVATLYDEPGQPGNNNGGSSLRNSRMVAVASNRIYVAVTREAKTFIVEITPTTAAGAGSGATIGIVPVAGWSLSYSGGLLYLAGDPAGTPWVSSYGLGMLVYFDPAAGTYGVVDHLLKTHQMVGPNAPTGMNTGVGFTENYISAASTLNSATRPNLLVHDAVNGGVHVAGRCLLTSGNTAYISDSQVFGGHVFFTEAYDSTHACNIIWWNFGAYEGDSYDPYIISPLWDFALADTKILSSLRISCEPVPTNWSILVDYQLDRSGSWTNAGTIAAGALGGTLTVSTDSTTKTFRQLQLRVRFVYGTSGTPSTTPVLYSVEARAQVTQKLRTWTVILDCSDDEGQAQNQSLKGHQKIDNIQTAGASSGNVVAFKNGFTHRQPNTYDEYDVIVDDYELFLPRPGEGYAIVRLIEVA